MKKYFIYSTQEMDFKKSLAEKNSKSFIPGTLVYKGAKKKFTSISFKKYSRFSDAIFTEIDTSVGNVSYTMPCFM